MEDVIQQFSSLSDLGVIISDNVKFNEHIEKVTKVVRKKIGWYRFPLYYKPVPVSLRAATILLKRLKSEN